MTDATTLPEGAIVIDPITFQPKVVHNGEFITLEQAEDLNVLDLSSNADEDAYDRAMSIL